MDSILSSEWVFFRVIFGVIFSALLVLAGTRIFGPSTSRFRDGVLFGSIGLLGLGVVVDPGLMERFVNLSHVRNIPLGRVVVLLMFTQLFWLAGILILRERSNAQNERFNNLVKTLSRELNIGEEQFDPSKFQEIMVVLPACREEANIAHVLRKIPKEIDGHSIGIMVVVDGIGDPTAEVIRSRFPHVVVLHQVIQIGSGAALLLGYQLCVKQGVRIVVSMDSDGQHDPEDLPKLVAPVLAGTHDVVIGNRLQGGWEVESVWRFVGLHIFGFLVRSILRINAWDCSNNYRAFLLKPILALSLKEAQYHTLELMFKAKRSGLRIGEAPTQVLARKSGSTKKGSTVLYGYQFLKRFFLYGLYRK